MSSNNSEIPKNILNTYVSMGFNEILLKEAWKTCKGQEQALLDEYQFLHANQERVLTQQSQQSQKITSMTNNMDEEKQVNEAIMASVQEAKENKSSFEPLNPEQRMRKDGIPVGLKNLGNTCYINPLLQVYYYNIEFACAILNFQEPTEEELKSAVLVNNGDNQGTNGQSLSPNEIKLKRVKASVKLVSSLQQLYLQFTGSDKKYIDPTDVIKNIVDDTGNQLQIGDQQDIGEFNITFLARVEEGLQHSKSALHGNAMEVEMSLSKLSGTSISMSTSSIVSQNFFGQHSVEMKYKLGEEQFTKKEEELFNIIFLDIKHKELYQALDEYVVNHIDEYKNDRGDVVPAQKHNWIKKAPNTLFFQLQRVIFNKETQRLQKINEPFQIEREIYLERFTEDRKDDYLIIRAKVNELVKQKHNLEKALNEITAFAGVQSVQIGILPLLEGTAAFLQKNNLNEELNPITNSTYFGNNSSENTAVLRVLQNYSLKIKDRIATLEKDIASLQNRIQESYNAFTKEKYYLQAVLVHDGLAESGHYYTFIQDLQNKKWWRYNDIQVSEETEANVFKEAVGGWGNASAYSLIYVREEIALPPVSARGTPLHLFLTSSAHNTLNPSQVRCVDYYSSIIPEEMLNQLCESNLKFQEEIDEYKTNNHVRNIVDLYVRRFEQNNESARKGQEARVKVRGSPPPFIQFCVYLKLHSGNDKGQYENIIKWLILDSCVREQYKGVQKLNSLTDKKLEQKLLQQMSSLSDFKALKVLTLSSQNIDLIEEKNNEFIQQLNNAETTIFAMQAALRLDWCASLSAIDFLNDLNKFNDIALQQQLKDDYFFKISRDTKVIILIALLHYCEVNMQLPSYSTAVLLANIKIFIAFYKKQCKFDPKTQLTFNAWIDDIASLSKDPAFTTQVRAINQEFMNNNSTARYVEAEELIRKLPEELSERHKKLVQEGDMYYWNVNKKEDCLFNELLSNFDKIKTNFSAYIGFTTKLRNSTVPLFKQDRIMQAPEYFMHK